jgi:hypothetical protein
MPLELTLPVIEMSIRNLPGGKGQPVHKADNLTVICEPWHLTTLWASIASYRDSFTSYIKMAHHGTSAHPRWLDNSLNIVLKCPVALMYILVHIYYHLNATFISVFSICPILIRHVQSYKAIIRYMFSCWNWFHCTLNCISCVNAILILNNCLFLTTKT